LSSRYEGDSNATTAFQQVSIQLNGYKVKEKLTFIPSYQRSNETLEGPEKCLEYDVAHDYLSQGFHASEEGDPIQFSDDQAA
jgi:hypothetical protein